MRPKVLILGGWVLYTMRLVTEKYRSSLCDGYVTAVATLRHDKARSPLTGYERTTSDLPSVTTTNYAKEKLALR